MGALFVLAWAVLAFAVCGIEAKLRRDRIRRRVKRYCR